MTLKINSAEGQPNGTTVAAGSGGNTGGAAGDYFTQVSPGAGGSVVFSTAQKAHGSNAYLFTPGTGTLCFAIMTEPTPGGSFSVRYYVYLTGYPSADTIFLEVDGLNGGTYGGAAGLHLTSSGLMRAMNGAGSIVASSTSANPIPLNQWVRVELQGTVGASTSLTWAYYATMDSATPTETFTRTGVVTNTNGTITFTDVGRIILGRFTSSGTCPPFYIDDLAMNLQSATALGAYEAPSLTTSVSVVPSTGNAPLVVSATQTASGGTGTPINYTFAWGDGSGNTGPQTSNTATHTYNSPGSFTVTATATNT